MFQIPIRQPLPRGLGAGGLKSSACAIQRESGLDWRVPGRVRTCGYFARPRMSALARVGQAGDRTGRRPNAAHECVRFQHGRQSDASRQLPLYAVHPVRSRRPGKTKTERRPLWPVLRAGSGPRPNGQGTTSARQPSPPYGHGLYLHASMQFETAREVFVPVPAVFDSAGASYPEAACLTK